MKILVVGSGAHEIYEKAISDAFKALGQEPINFFWSKYFYLENHGISFRKYINVFLNKVQLKIAFGPIIFKINRDILRVFSQENPEMVFINRGIYVLPKTIKLIRKSCIVFSYNNDDPFSKNYSLLSRVFLWRHYLKGIQYADHCFVYRKKNIHDMKNAGITCSSILRSYYIEKNNYIIKNEKKEIDVIFIGHFEDDGRDQYVSALIDNKINFVLLGPRWSRSRLYARIKNYLNYDPDASVSQLRYNQYLNRAKISIVFLSTLNNDTYTRRCFEIPAAKSMIFCQKTDDMCAMFKENEEAVYFSTPDEFSAKVNFYLEKSRYEKIARAGNQRMIDDGHEVKDRCKQILVVYNQVRLSRNIRI